MPNVRKTRNEGQQKDPMRHNMLVRIARLYYLRGMTHQEIANREGLSRIKVTRLLQEALAQHLVEFRISDPVIDTLNLEEDLQQAFGLRQVIITPSPSSEAEVYEVLGRFAADFLTRNLHDGVTIGIGWGRTLNGMLPYLERTACRGLTVVSLTGGLSANNRQPNPYDVASALADRLKADAVYPLLPAIVDSEQTRALFMKEKSVRRTIARWKSVQIALLSIGTIAADTGVYYSFEDPSREAERARSRGAVGDILAMPFDLDGEVVDVGFVRRLITISLEDLRKIPVVAGIAGGRHKAQALLGVLRSGFLTTLITDEETGRQVLLLAAKQKSKS
jgi:DNA-binding transcriptional regulator LsrR (DeoR family)